MLHRKATRALWTAAAIASWLVAVVLAIFHRDDSVRSLAQAVAVTLTVVGATARAVGRVARILPRDTAEYASPSVPARADQITAQIPRRPVLAMPVREQHEPGGLPVVEMGQLFRLGALDAKIGNGHRYHA